MEIYFDANFILNRLEILFLPITANRPFLLRPVLGEELLAAGQAVWLKKEAEDDGAVGRHRLVPVAGRPPDELAWSARALVILEGALEHECLLQRGVLVQRHDRARIELEQRRGHAAVVAIEHLDPNPRELGRFPWHVGDVEITRGQLRRVLGPDVGMHDRTGLRWHGSLLLHRRRKGGAAKAQAYTRARNDAMTKGIASGRLRASGDQHWAGFLLERE